MQRLRWALVAAAILCAVPAHGQLASRSDSAFWAGFEWRTIGPANVDGRVTDVEGIPWPSKTFFVASAAGGIWKTTNAGTTFRPVFEKERVVSMGDLAIAPSDTMQVWAGTGEEDSRNSISPGGGIYKSVDGGLTWTLMGLEQTQQIGRIVVDPRNPDVVYVAALGHVWGPNPERGLYKTVDGGRTWKLVKFVSDRAGFVDIAMDPTNPDVLFASSWERVRGPYYLKSGGPGGALWKTTDAGQTWTEVKGGGFPETMKGRIGVAIAPSDHNVVYALVEAAGKTKEAPNESGLYRSSDGGSTWIKMNDRDTRPFYYSQVRVDPKDPNRVYWSSTPWQFSDDGGKTVRTGTQGVHVDDHAMWIDPVDPEHFIVGNDGGVSQTFDRGGNFEYLNLLPIGQFYAVSYDMSTPYRVCGGLQDNGSWCGPSRRARGTINNYMWATIAGGDGFYTAQDPTDANTVYAESQGGNISRVNMATGVSKRLRKPGWEDRYREYEDSIIVERGDTTAPPPPEVKKHLAELRARQFADSVDRALRFNWNTPFLLSPHDPNVLYIGANKVLKAPDRGDTLLVISPDLTKRDTAKIRVSTVTTGGITPDVTGAETYATITALAESPVQKGLLYAGTDDGNVWLSPDGGAHWSDLTRRFKGLVPDTTWVSRIEPSHFDASTFYVAFDGHRTNDFTPYLFVTADGGKTFRSIAKGLPTGGPDFVHVIREDPSNRDLLFVGTDVGAYVSTDRGATWRRFMENFPTVPVHDLKIHPRDHDLIAATHGRSIWIVGIAPLEQLGKGDVLAGPAFFDPAPAFEFGDPPVGGESVAQQFFQAPSPDYGAQLTYWLPADVAASATSVASDQDGDQGAAASPGRPQRRGPSVSVAILNQGGDTVQTMTGPGTHGLHTVTWNFQRKEEPRKPLSPSELRDSVRAAARVRQIGDSLVAAGTEKRLVDRAVSRLLSGGSLRGLFGGRGAGSANLAGQTFKERPAESAPPAGTAERPQAEQGQPGGGESPEDMIDVIRTITGKLRDEGLRLPRSGRGGFFGGGRAPAPAGDYTVVITAGDKTLTRKLHVEGSTGEEDDEPGLTEEMLEAGIRF